DDEGLADVEAANPFRLPRLHPGIGWRRLTSAMPGGRRLQPCRRGAGGAGPAATGGAVRVSTSQRRPERPSAGSSTIELDTNLVRARRRRIPPPVLPDLDSGNYDRALPGQRSPRGGTLWN